MSRDLYDSDGYRAGLAQGLAHRSSGLVYHVYHPPALGKTFSVDMPEGHRAAWYGVKITGRPCILAIIHDAPRDASDQRWLDEDLYVRMAPAALTIHKWDDLDTHGRQAREAVEQ